MQIIPAVLQLREQQSLDWVHTPSSGLQVTMGGLHVSVRGSQLRLRQSALVVQPPYVLEAGHRDVASQDENVDPSRVQLELEPEPLSACISGASRREVRELVEADARLDGEVADVRCHEFSSACSGSPASGIVPCTVPTRFYLVRAVASGESVRWVLS